MASLPTAPPSRSPECTAEEAKVLDKLERTRASVVSDLCLDARPPKASSTTQGFKTPTILVVQDISSLQLRIAPRDPSPVDEDDCSQTQGCTTPKSKEHKVPEAKVCPPAPKKRTPKRKRECPAYEHFFVPSDLHALPDCIKALFK